MATIKVAINILGHYWGHQEIGVLQLLKKNSDPSNYHGSGAIFREKAD